MVIINAKILTMETGTIECGFLRIKGKIIEELGAMSDYRPSKQDKSSMRVRSVAILTLLW